MSAAKPLAATPTRAPGKRGRVLMLDDEPAVRRVLERLLRRAGYEVSAHEVASTARSLLAEQRFDLLLTDAEVPEGGVGGLVVAFQTANPGKQVIVCSGHTGDASLLDGIRREEYHFLPKPFAPNELLEMIESLLLIEKI